MSLDKYIDLIHKELTGELRTEEAAQLTAWINASDANAEEAEQIRLTWNLSGKSDAELESLVDFSIDADYDQLMSRIQKDEVVILAKETKVIPLFRRGWVAAAGLAILIGLAATFYFTSESFEKRNWELVETTNSPQLIVLADGSTVHLNANSSLHYPLTFDGENRHAELNGEGFFDIAKDPKHPFIVETAYESITVLGTSFNVRAFDDEPNSEIAVSTGMVSVESKIVDIILKPNDKVIVDHSSGVMELKETVALNELAWFTGKLEFHDASIPDVLHDLENQFDITFEYDYQAWEDCLFNASFSTVDLETILVSIETVVDAEINEIGSQVYELSGGGCQ